MEIPFGVTWAITLFLVVIAALVIWYQRRKVMDPGWLTSPLRLERARKIKNSAPEISEALVLYGTVTLGPIFTATVLCLIVLYLLTWEGAPLIGVVVYSVGVAVFLRPDVCQLISDINSMLQEGTTAEG